jgi:hypothetical protein
MFLHCNRLKSRPQGVNSLARSQTRIDAILMNAK